MMFSKTKNQPSYLPQRENRDEITPNYSRSLASNSYYSKKMERKSGRVLGLLLGVVGGSVMSIGTLLFLAERNNNYQNANIQIIKAIDNPYKIRPKDPGGMEVDNTDAPIYCRLSDCEEESGVSLLPEPESPIMPDKFNDTVQQTAGVEQDSKDISIKKNGFLIQLAALRSKDVAEQEWLRISELHSDLLAELAPLIQRVNLNEKGTLYRLRSGPIKERKNADELCSMLIDRKLECLVVPYQ